MSAPQLTGSGRHLPALELIIGTDGSVERARLLQGSRQLPDMMILSSAKMWRFEPAHLDGELVRYRLVVRLNAPGITRIANQPCLDRYAARNVNFVLVTPDRIAVLAARSAAEDAGNQPWGAAGYQGAAPLGWFAKRLLA